MKLLLIDPDISLVSPSMKGIIRSFPELRAAGFEIEVWCWRCDPGINPDKVVKLPSLGARLLGPLQAIGFSIIVSLRSFWLFQIRRLARPDVTFSLVPYLASCDVAHAQFSPWDWENRMKAMGSHTPKEWLERAANLIIRSWTNWFLCTTRARSIIVPSDAVADDFRRASDRALVTVLPNSSTPRASISKCATAGVLRNDRRLATTTRTASSFLSAPGTTAEKDSSLPCRHSTKCA